MRHSGAPRTTNRSRGSKAGGAVRNPCEIYGRIVDRMMFKGGVGGRQTTPIAVAADGGGVDELAAALPGQRLVQGVVHRVRRPLQVSTTEMAISLGLSR